ncbi:GNAT family N-acetyltransferase [Chryseobacterium lactis]|uniref:GNAT family N-acetyltransferase n=1 Tax=Chryseobacterium lactis TaxID=1241981 RepID=A0A3G6RTY2_CHRLC|nr:GNAT family N-acetyltransferase [Chryseobacterium lactis]AZA85016.1 GNAT family N-acetyltransferase [Chryseobacterium lactis]AZB07243.1 GNAT family N-acetyltransferase [Chryseobacterium lactis]PNW11443.1 GNAT family N-acetyltransferase [Chryseobacterium lactis]
MIIRRGVESDLPGMKQLFAETITEICKKDYTPEQLQAWKSGVDNHQRWEKVIKEQFVLIALSENKIVGFCTLDQGNYIDLLFVHQNEQHHGIASGLYALMEEEALRKNEVTLSADVSKTAKHFFEKKGFQVVKEQIVTVKGINLINYKMQKNIK